MDATRRFRKLGVVGAGTMGGGIAQKMASAGFEVTLLDVDDEKVARGLAAVRGTLAEGVERKLVRPEEADAALARIRGTTDWDALRDADLAVEAVFEDERVKRQVFERLDAVCRPEAILATNTSSLSVSALAAATRRPERVLGLHYFYHPAKNRLVEVVPGRSTRPDVARDAWALQERMGKTPIASADASGFVVNRYFVPWLNEAVRLLEEEVADLPTIEAACRKVFGVGMGPFELMNVTGMPIALHAATTLGATFGPLYAPADRLRQQVAAGRPWPLDGDADPARLDAIGERMLAVVFYVAAALVDEGVGTIEDTDIGARVGLRWPHGPFELMNRAGLARAAELVRGLTARWGLRQPATLTGQERTGRPFVFRLVRSEIRDGIGTLTLNRPDAMNALDETVVAQLREGLDRLAADPSVRGIVIAGAGKAFVAGADIRFFLRHMESKDLDPIVEFTRAGHALLRSIAGCPKPVVARVHGLALGGGLELALACHTIVASDRAAMAFPETGIGIYPGLGGTQRTPRRIGVGLAKWLIYTGERVGATSALDIGLVDEVVPHEELDAAVRRAADAPRRRDARTRPLGLDEVARFFESHALEDIRLGRIDTAGNERLLRAVKQVAVKAPLALRLTERLIDQGAALSLDAGLRLELDHLREIFSTADAYEGLSALGRRRPEFKGR
jgi:enoyl-CoA hydratase/3-hydroxyacyl-CoA dehydrogenase